MFNENTPKETWHKQTKILRNRHLIKKVYTWKYKCHLSYIYSHIIIYMDKHIFKGDYCHCALSKHFEIERETDWQRFLRWRMKFMLENIYFMSPWQKCVYSDILIQSYMWISKCWQNIVIVFYQNKLKTNVIAHSRADKDITDYILQ